MLRIFAILFSFVLNGALSGASSMGSGTPPFSVSEGERVANGDQEFTSKCRSIWEDLNPGAVMLRSVATVSPLWGMLWRADYTEVLDGRPVHQRMVCWRDRERGGLVVLYTELESSMQPLPDSENSGT